MLRIAQTRRSEPRLYLRRPALSAGAWLERSYSLAPYPGADWVLWYRLPHRPACMHKSQLRLELESVLRAWLLRRYRRRLYELSFSELCDLARRTRSGHPFLGRSLLH